MIIYKMHHHQNMNTTHLEIQWISIWVESLKPFTAKEITKIIHKSMTIKIDKAII